MPDMKRVEENKQRFANMSDGELISEMAQWRADSDPHVAIQLLLHERKVAADNERTKIETRRFHYFFWPALVGAITGVLSLIQCSG
jgi:hypothetical protein